MSEENGELEYTVTQDLEEMEYQDRVREAARIFYFNKATHYKERQKVIAEKLGVSTRTVRKYKDEPDFWDELRNLGGDDLYSMIPVANRELRKNVENGENRAIETVYDLTGMGRENERGSEAEPIYLAPADAFTDDEDGEENGEAESDSDPDDDYEDHIEIEATAND